jgi:putative peptide maturation system protein
MTAAAIAPAPASATELLPRLAEALIEASAGTVGRRELQSRLDELAAPLGLEVDLAWDRDLDTGVLHYNAVVTEPRGSFLLSFARLDDCPWAVRGAQHRADGLLLLVNGEPTMVGQALRSLEVLWQDASHCRQLVDQALLRRELAREPPATDDEVRAFIDSFRRARGLGSEEAFAVWLTRHGLTPDEFRREAALQSRMLRLRRRHTAGAAAYFEEHRSDLDRLSLAEWRFPTAEAAAQAAKELADESDLWGAIRRAASDPARESLLPSFREVFRRDLPVAPAATLIGPCEVDGEWALYRILGEKPARFEARTRTEIEAILHEGWLDTLRASAKVEWNWGLVPDAEGNPT